MNHTGQRISTLPKTLPDVLRSAAKQWGTRVALEDEASTRLSFNDLLQRCRRAAAAFMAAGIKRGDRICIWAPNGPEWIIAALGAQMAGGVLVPLNTRLKGREAAYIIDRSGARLLFTVKTFLGTDYPALLKGEALPKLEQTIVFGDATWSAFLALGEKITDAEVDRVIDTLTGDDISDIIFTSGTTGKPKGAMCAHAQTVATFQTWVDFTGLTADDRYLIVNPFFHTFGYKAGWLACLLAGATMYPHAVFDADAVIKRIAKHRITFIPGPPTLFQSMLASKARAGADLSSLRMTITGAASVPRQLIEQMHSDLGFETVLTAYGLTETNGTVSMCSRADPIEKISGTSGKPIPGVEVRCVGADDRDVPAGEPGEIWVRGYNVMRGYLDDPAATAAAIDKDGWLKTGDIGIIDAEGYIRVTDRKKDMFIVGGFNCYPAEIEELMLDHPAVAQAAVVGVPDERMGEVAKAFIILRAGAAVNEKDLIAWCREHMANFKVPRSIEFVTQLPVTASGKVQRFALREGESTS